MTIATYQQIQGMRDSLTVLLEHPQIVTAKPANVVLFREYRDELNAELAFRDAFRDVEEEL